MIVGVVGQLGAGKDELVHHLEKKYNARAVSTGDIVRQTAQRENVPESRNGLQRVAKEYLEERGPDYFARKAIERVEKGTADLYVVSGLRTPADVRTMRERYRDDFVLACVDVTHPMARFERLQKRNERRDPESLDEMQKQDREEDELFELDNVMEMADVTVNNDGTLGAFHRSIERRLVQPYLQQGS